MIRPSVEYVGFHCTEDRREYVLRLRAGEDIRQYTVGIALAAFSSGRVRYQDGPEISFLKLSHELEANGAAPVDADFTVSEDELSAYRTAHPAAKNRLSSPAPQVQRVDVAVVPAPAPGSSPTTSRS
jgi:hypothetical protein